MKQILKNILTIKHLWGGLIPLHIFALWAIYNVASGSAPAWWWVASLVGWFFMKFVGIGAGFHRLFSHHGYQVSTAMELLRPKVVLFFG
jgi:fatty-acid desaturase